MTKIHDPSDPKYVNDVVDKIIDEHAQKVALQTLRTITPDEQILVQCAAFWDAVTKHPVTGEMHRKHASTLMWMLGQVSDWGLMQCADAIEPFKPMSTARQCCSRMSQIILKRRGVGRTQILVN